MPHLLTKKENVKLKLKNRLKKQVKLITSNIVFYILAEQE